MLLACAGDSHPGIDRYPLAMRERRAGDEGCFVAIGVCLPAALMESTARAGDLEIAEIAGADARNVIAVSAEAASVR